MSEVAETSLNLPDVEKNVDIEQKKPVKKVDFIRPRTDSLESTSVMGDNDNENDDDVSDKARRKLILACILVLAFMVVEIIGGIISGSLSIMTDALHLLTDLVGFCISIAALTLSKRPANRKLTFGWYRAEILGALITVILVWAITAVLVMLAIQRVVDGTFEIEANIMLITSSLGVAMNLFMGVQLQHGHSHGPSPSHGIEGGHSHSQNNDEKSGLTTESNRKTYGTGTHSETIAAASGAIEMQSSSRQMNVRAAIMNMLGDLCQSVGVMIAALIVFFEPAYKIADPICTFLFSVFVLTTTVIIIRDVFHILMEGAPANVNFEAMKMDLYKVSGVLSVHHVRIWALTSSKIAMAAHIEYSGSDYTRALKRCRKILRKKYGITDLTIQIEVEPECEVTFD